MRNGKSERLDAEKIGVAMKNKIRISVFRELDSTNAEARRQAEQGLSFPALILAESQSAGRGRLGRSFYSPAGTGLYMTLACETGDNPLDNVGLTAAAAVAAARTIGELCGREPMIKWVNDIYMDGKKVCGILCESFFARGKKFIAVGVGINLYTEDFPEELRELAASVRPDGVSRNLFASNIADRLLEYKTARTKAEIMEYYRAHSLALGRKIIFTDNGKWVGAVAENVDDMGRLEVRLEDGSRRLLSSGEISLRLDDTKEI